MKQKKPPSEPVDRARRRWLGAGARTAGAAAVAAGSLPLPRAGAAGAAEAAVPAPDAATGYQDTERVRQYYRLARY